MRNSVEMTLAGLAFRQLTSSKRSLWAVALAALPILLSVLIRMKSKTPEAAVGEYVIYWQTLTVAVLLPIIALVVGTGIFGAEVEDGTLTYVLGKPVARWRMVVTRIVVAGLATAAVLVPATLISGFVALEGMGPEGLVPALAAALALGGFLYCALFVALSLATRRALVAGLAYVVIWEGLLAGSFGGIRALSVRYYTQAFANGLVSADVIGSPLEPGKAAVLAAVVAVLAALYATRRLRRFEIGEAV
ncbi:MAG TPA: ABC transporter permease [Longimicrobium sp.]|nr:ABC transporter permease [Longimicrobium sp.]